MRLDKLAITAQEALQAAMGIAGEHDNPTVEPIHLLAALIDSNENNLEAIIKRIGADAAQLRTLVSDEVEKLPRTQGSMSVPSNALLQVLDRAVKAAEKLGDSYATSEHVLIALSEDKGAAGRIL